MTMNNKRWETLTRILSAISALVVRSMVDAAHVTRTRRVCSSGKFEKLTEIDSWRARQFFPRCDGG